MSNKEVMSLEDVVKSDSSVELEQRVYFVRGLQRRSRALSEGETVRGLHRRSCGASTV